jgi:hypothetical protein
MLLANKEVAKYVKSRGLLCINRVHEAPDISKLMALKEFVKQFDYELKLSDEDEIRSSLNKLLAETKNTLQEAQKGIGTSVADLVKSASSINKLRLVASLTLLHSDVFNETIRLLNAWGKRVPAPLELKATHDQIAETYSVTDHCWRILLKSYLQEEHKDFERQKNHPRKLGDIPAAVIPIDREDIDRLNPFEEALAGELDETAPEDYSFIATTVGFYATLLANIVHDLSEEAKKLPEEDGKPKRLCMAILTNMLPAHCWDWPMPDGSWSKYQPIKDYRNNMISAVGEGAQIDRVIMVYDDPKGSFQFVEDDFVRDNATGTISLLQKLLSHNPLSDYVRENLSEGVSQYLPEVAPISDPLKQYPYLVALASDLNKLIELGSLYSPERFDAVPLSAELRQLSTKLPTGNDMIRMNRLLLEEAFSNEIVKVYRRPAFYHAHEAHESYFWRKALLDYMLDEWHVLVPSNPNVPELPGGEDWWQPGTPSPELPYPIYCAAKNTNCDVHPFIVGEATQTTFIDQNRNKWKSKSLIEEYKKALHGPTGHCWMLPLAEKSLSDFNGRHDVMFIGIGSGSKNDEGLWDDESCDWGLCLMSSMNPVTQTMLLTVISGKGVKDNYGWFRARLKNRVDWAGGDQIKPELVQRPVTP